MPLFKKKAGKKKNAKKGAAFGGKKAKPFEKGNTSGTKKKKSGKKGKPF